eukprot:TRINITY_DN46920_c0_g1_i1.p1 TRINITY_DN46920_c0_g1~~TRINITY_DN46920_c0_g1_i1.p1  ORF type:complete len:584 (+),score=125.34 TRINITY_DN46920_c0_g1_i1:125-1876(+)
MPGESGGECVARARVLIAVALLLLALLVGLLYSMAPTRAARPQERSSVSLPAFAPPPAPRQRGPRRKRPWPGAGPSNLTEPAACLPSLVTLPGRKESGSGGELEQAPLWVFGAAGQRATAAAGMRTSDGGGALSVSRRPKRNQPQWSGSKWTLPGVLRRVVDWDMPGFGPDRADLPEMQCRTVWFYYCFSCCTAQHYPRCDRIDPKAGRMRVRGRVGNRRASNPNNFVSPVGQVLQGAQWRSLKGWYSGSVWHLHGEPTLANAAAQAMRAQGIQAEVDTRAVNRTCTQRLRRVMVLPPNRQMLTNYGHLLGDGLASALEARAALPGPVDMILETTGKLAFISKRAGRQWGPSCLEEFQRIAPVGQPEKGACVDHVQVACPTQPCPFMQRRGRAMPAIRRFLNTEFSLGLEETRFGELPPAPHLVLAVRHAGKRHIDNSPALATAAREMGWNVTVLQQWRDCPELRSCTALMQSADVFVSWHGSDIDMFLHLFRAPAVVVETNIISAMRLGHWGPDGTSQLWQAAYMPEEVTYFAWFVSAPQPPPHPGESNVHRVGDVTVPVPQWRDMLATLRPVLRQLHNAGG